MTIPTQVFATMPEPVPDIVILDRPIETEELRALVERYFEDMERIRELTRLIGRGEPLS